MTLLSVGKEAKNVTGLAVTLLSFSEENVALHLWGPAWMSKCVGT